MASVLVVGTNQGIGLGIVEQLLKSEEVGQVFATVRDPASSSCDDINKLAASNPKLHIIKLLLDPKSAQAAASEVGKLLDGEGLDILIHNAGIGQPFTHPQDAPLELFREQFEVNVLGPQIVLSTFLPLLRKGNKKIIMTISSLVGSIAYNDGRYPFNVPAYGASKAALNFLTVDYAKYLKPEGFIVVPLSPGYIRTRLSPDAPTTVDVSATGIVKVLFSLKPEDTGKFFSYDGTTHPY